MKKALLFILSLSISIISIAQSLSGTYTIGHQSNITYDFNSINAAVDSLEQVGVSGVVVFKIDSGVYNEQIHIHHINSVSALNTVTFESLSGDSTDVIISHSISDSIPWVIKFDSVSYINLQKVSVSVNGSYPSNPNPPANLQVYSTIRISFYSTNISLLNNTITAGSKGENNISGVYASGIDVSIKNNKILNGGSSIIIDETQNLAANNGTDIIANNELIDFKFSGIGSSLEAGYTRIYNNHIETSIDTVQNVGINCLGWNSIIRNNKIINTTTAISVIDNLELYVYNNFISIDRPGFVNKALDLMYQSHISFMFNTVNIISGDSLSSCINQAWGNDEYLLSRSQIINNIFTNTVGPMFIMEDSALSFTDYNIFHGNSPFFARLGIIPVNYSSLASIQQNGLLSNCIDSTASFISNTDLHLSSNQFSGFGTATISTPFYASPGFISISNDIDYDARNMVNVRPGADEVFVQDVDIMPISIITPIDTFTYPSSDSFRIVVYNNASIMVSSYQVRIDTNSATLNTFTINNSIFPYEYDTLLLSNLVFPANSFTISATTIHPQDLNPSNDSIAKQIMAKVYNVGISSIILLDTMSNSDSATVAAWVTNYGNMAMDSIAVSYTSNNVTVMDMIFSNIDPGDSILFTFTQNLDISPSNPDSIVCVSTLHPKDKIAANNTLCKQFAYNGSIGFTSTLSSNNPIVVYPNPAYSQIAFNIGTITKTRNIKLSIFNNLGQEIKAINIEQNTKTIKILLNDFTSGIYYYQILGSHGLVVSSGKFSKL